MTGEECVAKLRFGKMSGQNRLTNEEEINLATQGLTAIEEEASRMLGELFNKPYTEVLGALSNRRLNSLLWVYFECQVERVALNIRIAGMRLGITSINEIASKASINASFLGKLLNGESVGGWNMGQVLKISTAINLDPRTMLFSDLAQLIEKENERYKSE